MAELLEPHATRATELPDTPDLPAKPRLLDQMRASMRTRHYSLRTEKTYTYWVRYYIHWHGMRHPRDMGAREIGEFLSMLANAKNVAPSTQNQALAALLYLYKNVLDMDLPWIDGIARAKKSTRLPVVLTQAEVQRVLANTTGTTGLIIRLMYGTGMRLMEAMRLRVNDIEFDAHIILVRDGKGGKDRVVPLPSSLIKTLRDQIAARRKLHDIDLARGMVDVQLPHALARKYPNAPREWAWQYVFAAADYSIDPQSRAKRRHHLHEKTVQRAMRQAVRDAGIDKPACCHTLRHSFATHNFVAFICNRRNINNLHVIEHLIRHRKREARIRMRGAYLCFGELLAGRFMYPHYKKPPRKKLEFGGLGAGLSAIVTAPDPVFVATVQPDHEPGFSAPDVHAFEATAIPDVYASFVYPDGAVTDESLPPAPILNTFAPAVLGVMLGESGVHPSEPVAVVAVASCGVVVSTPL